MHAKSVALAVIAAMALRSVGQSAPIQVIARVAPAEPGSVTVSGLNGEIYFSIRAPDEKLRRANYLLGGPFSEYWPNQLSHLNLGGMQGTLEAGDILYAGFPPSYYQEIRFVTQANFTSPISSFAPQFVAPGFQPPPGVEGFWVTAVPEPGGFVLAAISAICVALRLNAVRGGISAVRTKLTAAAFLALIALTASTSAAPIQAVARVGPGESGNVTVSGFTGEIYFALVGPEEKLRRENFIDPRVCDCFYEGELPRLNLSGFGFQDSVSMGDVLWPGHLPSYYADFRLRYQSAFTSPLLSLPPPIFVPPGFNPPAGVEGFWITAIPEPATLGMLGWSLLGLSILRRNLSVDSPRTS